MLKFTSRYDQMRIALASLKLYKPNKKTFLNLSIQLTVILKNIDFQDWKSLQHRFGEETSRNLPRPEATKNDNKSANKCCVCAA